MLSPFATVLLAAVLIGNTAGQLLFKAAALGATAPEETTTLTVTWSPGVVGLNSASLLLGSNDPAATVVLVPLDGQLLRTIREVRIDGSADQLLRVEIRQSDGDRSLMTLRAPAAP